jgi:hypothetical protein
MVDYGSKSHDYAQMVLQFANTLNNKSSQFSMNAVERFREKI